MRTIIFGIFTLILSVPCMAADCIPQKLSKDSLKLVRPLMALRIKQNHEQFTKDGHWKGESKYTPEVEKQFNAILDNTSRAGDEAVAYLLNVYMGEYQGEELVCEAINRGKRMIPLIKSYSKCIPRIGVEPLPKYVKGSDLLYRYALVGINKGEKCQDD